MPHFLAMYFEQPDSSCHAEGPDSDLVKSGLIYVDAMINYLLYRLDRKGLLGCLNIVIVSDHGGQALHREKFVPISKYIDVSDPNMYVFPGPVGHINFLDLSKSNISKIMESFECKLNHSFRVYSKEHLPKRYHYTNSDRIGPIIFDGYPGARLFKSQKEIDSFTDKGDHGYDNRNREMRAIFGAYGPDIHRQKIIPPFQNIELYNLFTDLMRLPVVAPNNGTKGVLYSVMKTPPNYIEPDVVNLELCENVEIVKCGDGCYFKLTLNDMNINILSSKDARIPELPTIKAPRELVKATKTCMIKFFNSNMAYSQLLKMPLFVESLLTFPVANIDHRANCSVVLLFDQQLITNNKSTDLLQSAAILISNKNNTNNETINFNNKFEIKKLNALIHKRSDRSKLLETEVNTITSIIAPNNLTITTKIIKDAVFQTATPITLKKDINKICQDTVWNKLKWISLFPDNDYARFILQGQIRVPNWFYNGPWKYLLDLIIKYQRHYKKLLMVAGPIYDYNNDGLADNLFNINFTIKKIQPTHVFVILMRCIGSEWKKNYLACKSIKNTTTLSFVLPLINNDNNCLFLEEYLFLNTVRIRDIELLTNMEWFTDKNIYSMEQALLLRTALSDQLWQLEVE